MIANYRLSRVQILIKEMLRACKIKNNQEIEAIIKKIYKYKNLKAEKGPKAQ